MIALRKIVFWLGVILSLLISVSISLAELGNCKQGDESIYALFTQVAFAVSLFCIFAAWYGIPSGGLVGISIAILPFLFAVYYYIAYIPVYFIFSTIQGQNLCTIIQFDLSIGTVLPVGTPTEPGTVFSRLYAIAILFPVLCSILPVYRIWKTGSFSKK